MVLSTGARLGPYEILALLGAGGMGDVYKARDARLDRIVAIKVLPEHVAADPDLRERFEREAEALAALSHPHICPVYDVGEADLPSPQPLAPSPRIQFLVMEYLEGETLAQRLAKGALPLDEALRTAVQVGDALDKAHRQGIVHRDLKPGNIMLTKSGAKLLDFGLAKLGARPSASGAAVENVTAAPTVSTPLTAHGAIVGTFQYMAPEQIEGQEAHARTDIFAFGAVLYEMITGRRAFEGRSQASLIAAIMHVDPPPASVLQPLNPASVDRVIRKCLAKEPDERWQTAHDLRDELTWIAEHKADASLPASVSSRSRRREVAAWGLAGVLAMALLAAIAIERSREPAQPGAIRFAVSPPEGALLPVATQPVALSPDGRHLAFVAFVEGQSMLAIRSMDTLEVRVIPGTEGIHTTADQFWSPDGEFVAFAAAGRLKKVARSGGAPQTLADAPQFSGGTWSPAGVILFAPGASAGLMQVSSAGGEPTPVTTLDASLGERSHRWPYFLPDGRSFLYLAQPANTIFVGTLESTDRKRLLTANSKPEYMAGYVLAVRHAHGCLRPGHTDHDGPIIGP